jgi:hypothetical protein
VGLFPSRVADSSGLGAGLLLLPWTLAALASVTARPAGAGLAMAALRAVLSASLAALVLLMAQVLHPSFAPFRWEPCAAHSST